MCKSLNVYNGCEEDVCCVLIMLAKHIAWQLFAFLAQHKINFMSCKIIEITWYLISKTDLNDLTTKGTKNMSWWPSCLIYAN